MRNFVPKNNCLMKAGFVLISCAVMSVSSWAATIPYPLTTNTTSNNAATNGNDFHDLSGLSNGFYYSLKGDDRIFTNNWSLVIEAGGGNDVIELAGSATRAYGQSGNDYFVFDDSYINTLPNWDTTPWATIEDYQDGSDKLAFLNAAGGMADFADVNAVMVQSGNDVVLDIPGNHNVIIKNTLTSDLQASDFIFSDDGSNPPGSGTTVSTINALRDALIDPGINRINVAPGNYFVRDASRGDGFRISRDLVIASTGAGSNRANFFARTNFAKAIFLITQGASVTFDGIGFYDTRGNYSTYESSNEAGIRHEGGDLTIINCRFAENHNAILGTPVDDRGGHLIVQNSIFRQNGDTGGGGQEHQIYFQGLSATIEDSDFLESGYGHTIKTVVKRFTELTNNTIDDGNSPANHAVNLEGGGALIATGNTIFKGASAGDNPYVFYIETIRRGGWAAAIRVRDNQINTQHPNTILLGNLSNSKALINNNILTGSFNPINLVYGQADFSGTTLNGVSISGTDWRTSANSLTHREDQLFLTGAGVYYLSSTPALAYKGLSANDVMVASPNRLGSEVFFGGAGDDILSGMQRNDFLYGETGDDIIFAGSHSSWAFGGPGNDHIVAGPIGIEGSIHFMSGHTGDDILDARNSFKGRMDGGPGNDLLIGSDSSGNGDDFNGGSGNDVVYGGGGVERYFYGGYGIDTVVYASAYGPDLTVDFQYDRDLRVRSISAAGVAEVGDYWESPRQFEFIQFSNGVYDVRNRRFIVGVTRPGADVNQILATPYPTHP